MTALSGLTVVALMMSNSAISEQVATRADLSARYAADAALAVAVTRLNYEGPEVLPQLQQPVEMGGVRYWVETVTDPSGLTSMVATGESGRTNFRQQLVVRRSPITPYQFGAFGDEWLELASNAQVDSYRSNDGPYDGQRINGSGQSAWARDDGNLGSNAGIHLKQLARAYGDARPGPASVVTIVGNAFVTGTTLPSPDKMELDPIDTPTFASSGPLVSPQQGTLTIPSGQHAFTTGEVSVGSTLKIIGPAQLVFDSLEVFKNASIEVDGTAGMVEIYVKNDFIMSSNAQIASTTLNPADVAVFLESDNIIEPGLDVDLDQVDFESNSKLYGTLYAPNAHVIINSNFQLFGSLVARRLRLDSNSQVHYDESLLENREVKYAPIEVIGWRVLPRRANAVAASNTGGEVASTDPQNPDGLAGGTPTEPTQQ